MAERLQCFGQPKGCGIMKEVSSVGFFFVLFYFVCFFFSRGGEVARLFFNESSLSLTSYSV